MLHIQTDSAFENIKNVWIFWHRHFHVICGYFNKFIV